MRSKPRGSCTPYGGGARIRLQKDPRVAVTATIHRLVETPILNHSHGSTTNSCEKTGLAQEIRRSMNWVTKRSRKEPQRQWNRLRKLNNRFRKKVCKQQQLRADICKLQKEIIETKQEIISHHREIRRAF